VTREEKRTCDLIGRIYEAATEPKLWDAALREVADFAGRPCG
jgi:hypothetical protein